MSYTKGHEEAGFFAFLGSSNWLITYPQVTCIATLQALFPHSVACTKSALSWKHC